MAAAAGSARGFLEIIPTAVRSGAQAERKRTRVENVPSRDASCKYFLVLVFTCMYQTDGFYYIETVQISCK